MRKLYIVLGLLTGSILQGQAFEQLLISTRIASGGSGINTTALQSANALDSSGVIVFPMNVTAGSALWLGFGSDNNATNLSGCTDTRGNTWVFVGRANTIAGLGTGSVEVWVVTNAIAGATTVTCTLTLGTQGALFIREYGNANTSNAVDDFSATSSGTGDLVALDTSGTDELLIIIGQGDGTTNPCMGFNTVDSLSDNTVTVVQQMAAATAQTWNITGCTNNAFFSAYLAASLKGL